MPTRTATAVIEVSGVHRAGSEATVEAAPRRGPVEEGSTTTPFDICVTNRIDLYNRAIDVIVRMPRLRPIGAHARDRQWSGAVGPKLTDDDEPLPELV